MSTSDPFQQQPSSGYGGAPLPPAPPPGPYGAYPQPRSGRTALIVVGVVLGVIVLFIAGFVALIVVGFHSAKHAIDSFGDYPGAPDHPLTVAEGQTFSINGMFYSQGWQVGSGSPTQVISRLSAANFRRDGDTDTVLIQFRFLDGTRVLGEVDCRSGASLASGQSKLLSCTPEDLLDPGAIAGYDTIQVSDVVADF